MTDDLWGLPFVPPLPQNIAEEVGPFYLQGQPTFAFDPNTTEYVVQDATAPSDDGDLGSSWNDSFNSSINISPPGGEPTPPSAPAYDLAVDEPNSVARSTVISPFFSVGVSAHPAMQYVAPAALGEKPRQVRRGTAIARREALQSVLGFQMTNPSTISSYHKRWLYMKSLEHYVVFLRNQYSAMNIPIPPFTYREKYEDLTSTSLQTMVTYMENLTESLHGEILTLELKFARLCRIARDHNLSPSAPHDIILQFEVPSGSNQAI